MEAVPHPSETDVLFNPERLAEAARAMARDHRDQVRAVPRRHLQPMQAALEAAEQVIRKTYRVLAEAARRDEEILPAGEWILDNYYILQEQADQFKEHFTRSYFEKLPCLAFGPLRGYPRIYEIVRQLASFTDNVLDERTLSVFVRGYQEEELLTLGELWALPLMARYVLVQALEARSQEILEDRRTRHQAQEWVRRLTDAAEGAPAEADPAESLHLLAALTKQHAPLSGRFLLVLVGGLHSAGLFTDTHKAWLEQHLRTRGTSLDAEEQKVYQRQTQQQVSVANAVIALRGLAETDWSGFVEALSAVEQTLRLDPAGIYPAMDFETRDRYRGQVEHLAEHSPMTEFEVAQQILLQAEQEAGTSPAPTAGHVGVLLEASQWGGAAARALEQAVGYRTPPGRRARRFAYRHPSGVYGGAIIVSTLAVLALLVGATAPLAASPGVWVLLLGTAFLLALDVAIVVTNSLLTFVLPPRTIPKMAFAEGIPDEHRTLVVVPVLLTSPEHARAQAEQLEVRSLANPDPALRFALVTSLPDASSKDMPEDAPIVTAACTAIRRLNEAYDGEADRFFLLHRERRWNGQEGVWMGWERKRGALDELNRLLCDPKADTSIATIEGDVLAAVADEAIRYVITLDADTQLPPGSARDLVRAAAHPLNQPVIDEERGRVVEGYGILQPRISIVPESAYRTPFARLFSGNVGLDPYTTAVSDVYQDLFGAGIFTGKGLYHVDAFTGVLGGVIPENRVLSHDLLEGNYARTALVTDIELYDDYPSCYRSYARRQHRWMRGDWQIARWLFPRVPTASGTQRNPISGLGRWKIVDNLRRSLTAPVLLLFLLFGWVAYPASAPLWTVIVLVVLSIPIHASVPQALAQRPRGASVGQHLRSLLKKVGVGMQRAGFWLAVLPHQALLALDAIGRTLWRMLVSRRHLLEWVTASQVEEHVQRDLPGYVRAMGGGVLLGLAMASVAVAFHVATAIVAVPLGVLWAGAPYLVWRLSQSSLHRPPALTGLQRRQLRTYARRTWGYFETYVGPRHRWLPPDNVQMAPRKPPAPRTSPTNMGLSLLATLAAYDLGYLPRGVMLRRLLESVGSMRLLERFRGHFYNWYHTHDGRVLRPNYISTVDSGNLAASLIVLREAMQEVAQAPWPNPACIDGVRDGVQVLREEVDRLRQDPSGGDSDDLEAVWRGLREIDEELPDHPFSSVPALRQTLTRVGKRVDHLQATIDEAGVSESSASLHDWGQRLQRQVDAAREEVDLLFHEDQLLVPEIDGEGTSLQTLYDVLDEAAGTSAPAEAVQGARTRIGDWLDAAQRLRQWCDSLIEEMDFGFLFDPKRGLFAVGFNEEKMERDGSTYDLFASEARVASFVAIAKGEVPPSHWFRLSRRLTDVEGRRVLVSWGGTMFEYLMPLLFMRRYPGTLLGETYEHVVYAQQHYGARQDRPWGLSESAYNMLNLDLDYQYRAFGVPDLGLKRGLAEDYVAAPYATMLALCIDPPAALSNLQRLQRAGAYDAMGFVEAVDYTPSRTGDAGGPGVVRTYMVHHQGMGLLAMVNALCDRVIQRRFHRDPLVRAGELLLQERVPTVYALTDIHAVEAELEPSEEHAVAYSVAHVGREHLAAATPRVHMLSNGRFRTLLTAAGGGYSAVEEVMLTRWRADRTRDADGFFVYVRDLDSGSWWSMGHQPAQRPADRYDAWYHVGKAEMARVDDWIETFMEVCVSPEDDIELRRLTLTNYADEPRRLEVTSYAEVVLNEPRAHEAHPAFSKLFVQTEYLPEHHALLAHRRPRDPDERALWLVHVLASDDLDDLPQPLQVETDRAQFIGRGRSPARPRALDAGVALSGSVGSVLDPVVSLRRVVEMGPGEKVQLTFSLGAAPDREAARALADRYDNPYAVDRAFSLARVYSLIQIQHLNIAPERALAFQTYVGALLYGHPDLRAPEELLLRSRGTQADLWKYGVSGDHPLAVVRIRDVDDLPEVREVLKAHAYAQLKGLAVDLLILNDHPPSYVDEVDDLLTQAVETTMQHVGHRGRGRIYVRRTDDIPPDDLALIQRVARVVLNAGDSIMTQARAEQDATGEEPPERRFAPAPLSEAASTLPGDAEPLMMDNGWGGFAEDGATYVVRLTPDPKTSTLKGPPLPWTNVLANDGFGQCVTELGAGCTWSQNSRENRLTPWSNDPIAEPPSEALYVRDDEAGRFWSPLPAPVPAGAYEVRHRPGETTYHHQSHDLEQEVCCLVPPEDPVKVVQVRITNRSERPRRLTVFWYARWVLGVLPEQSRWHVTTRYDDSLTALLARNVYNNEFAGRVAFASVLGGEADAISVTADRTAFLGRHGTLHAPEAIVSGQPLDGRTGAGLDPCAAFAVPLALAPGETTRLTILMGEAPSKEAVTHLLERYRHDGAVAEAEEQTRAFWQDTLSTLQVQTPSPALNVLVNHWLLYQTVACRLWGRTAFYQSGGAFGFRDQLQDVAALLYTRPDLARAQLLLHARHQFVEGDVLHWWHPPTGRGIRSRISDDLLWLPYVTLHYVRTTGDTAVLNERIPFLTARALEDGEDEAYLTPEVADEEATVYEHCCRAIDRSLTEGPHGLPLIGAGDWNDGMNRVGREGRGESVWLGFFLVTILHDVVEYTKARGDDERTRRYTQYRSNLVEALDEAGWDGAWYRRAYFDDGTPLGSAQNDECQIDALVQAWSVLSGAASAERGAQALQAVEERLIDDDTGLIRLLTPPFDQTENDPGYINAYVPGVRENGGQYTHAALWVVGAMARLGWGTRVGELLERLSPAHHTRTSEAAATYKTEPYAVAADVYGVPPHVGRGGWTWYTGSAGWMYRVIVEAMLGFTLRGGDTLVLRPCIPATWETARIRYRLHDGATIYEIEVTNPDGCEIGIREVLIDEVPGTVEDDEAHVPLHPDGTTHHVTLIMGSREESSDAAQATSTEQQR